jgi:hypothetical protein
VTTTPGPLASIFPSPQHTHTHTQTHPPLRTAQSASCPVYDLPSNVGYGGQTQTLTRQAQLYVPSPGRNQSLFIVLMMDPSGESKIVKRFQDSRPPKAHTDHHSLTPTRPATHIHPPAHSHLLTSTLTCTHQHTHMHPPAHLTITH